MDWQDRVLRAIDNHNEFQPREKKLALSWLSCAVGEEA